MEIPKELVTKLVTVMNDNSSKKPTSNEPIYGTITKYGSDLYVKLDGSDLLTPMSSTVDVEDGERVLVSIIKHTATIVGNVSSPAARKSEVDKVSDIANEANNSIVAINNKLVAQDNNITAINNKIEAQGNTIVSINNKITSQGNDITAINDKITSQDNTITSISNTVTSQGNDIIAINNTITSQGNTIKQLNDTVVSHGNTLTQVDNDITSINNQITSQDNTISEIDNKLNLQGNTIDIINSSFEITNGVVTGIKGVDTEWIKVKDLEANAAEIESLKAKKADIDLANVNNAWIQNGIIKDGSIGSAAIHDGAITNVKIADATIEAAKIKSINADNIVAGTIKTDRLIITGPDGQDSIVKAINIANGVSEAEVNSKQIQAASIDVVDLSAFRAKIADFDLNQNAIYSNKTSIKDPSSGIYISTTGLGIGNGLLTGKDESPIQMYADGVFKLVGKNGKLDFNAVTGDLELDVTKLKINSKAVATSDDLEAMKNETTPVLKVFSSNGTSFKDTNTKSVLTVIIYKGNNIITDETKLHEVVGPDSYLKWYYKKSNSDKWIAIDDTDERITNDGFTFTTNPVNTDQMVDYRCTLIDTPYTVFMLDQSKLDAGALA